VRCSSEIIRLHKIYSPQQAWVIHGFRSNSNVLSNYLSETGIYISIGDKFNEEAVKIIPNDRLMLETDESTLSIEEIAERVAKVRSQSIQEVLNHIAQNNKTALFLE
jgi:TatD DNase family protein